MNSEGVGPASISASEVAAVDDTLMATWKALQRMVKDKGLSIQKVAAVTADGELIDSQPVIIGFPDPKGDKSGLSDSAKAWVYLDHKAQTLLRGVMLLQVTTKLGIGYIMEVQRRPAKTAEGNVQSSGAYQYLAFSLDAGSIALKDWIAILVPGTANALGVVSKVGAQRPGLFKPFNHIGEERGGIKGAILNGLMGVGLVSKK